MQITRKTYGWLGTSLILALLGWMVDHLSDSTHLLPTYAKRIGSYYHAHEATVEEWIQKTEIWTNIYRRLGRNEAVARQADLGFLQYWQEQPVDWLLYGTPGLALHFWTDKEVVVPDSLLLAQLQEPGRKAVWLNNGFYVLHGRQIIAERDSMLLIGIVPVYYDYLPGDHQLRRGFADINAPLPPGLQIDQVEGVAVTASEGEHLFYLKAGPGTYNKRLRLLGLVLYLLAFLSAVMLINHLANGWGRRRGLILITISVMLAAGLYYAMDWDRHYAGLAIFETTAVRFPFRQSVIAFTILSLLLLWPAVYIQRRCRWGNWTAPSEPAAWGMAILIYTASALSLLLQFRLLQSLVVESDFRFDFINVFGWDHLQRLSVGSSLIVMLAAFLLNHRLLQGIRRLDLNVFQRTICLTIALLLAWPMISAIGLLLRPFIALLPVFLYVLFIDLTLDNTRINLSATLLWMLILSIFAGQAMTIFNQRQDLETQIYYARVLGEARDTILERSVMRMGEQLAQDPEWRSFWQERDTNRIVRKQLTQMIDDYFNADAYLLQHYRYEAWVIDSATRSSRLMNQAEEQPAALLEALATAEAVDAGQDLAYWPSFEYPYLYAWYPNGRTGVLQVIVTISPQIREDRRVYGDMIEAIPYKGLTALPRYEYAVQSPNRLMKQEGRAPALQLLMAQELARDSFVLHESGNRTFVLYNSPESLQVAINPRLYGIFGDRSLFAYLFVMLVLIGIVIVLPAYYVGALPDTIDYSELWRASIRNRIQWSVLLLMAGAFAVIWLVTTGFFHQNIRQVSREQLNQKAQAVLSDIEYNIALKEEIPTRFDRMASSIYPIAGVHNMDINVYNPRGGLILTTAEYLFDRELTARRMNPLALRALQLDDNRTYHSLEEIGGLRYQSIYFPLPENDGRTAAYLEVPYYTNDLELRRDLQIFQSTLLTLFVVLFLGATAVALFMANFFTRSLDALRLKMRQLRLGSREVIEWKFRDEIGQLISEYNDMVRTLADSTEKLRLSEREGAWRQMAKQVAHEIKNPLTPMKLKIQHLLRIYQQDPEKARAMLPEVAQGLIRQIDGLSRIAGEFSDFAKMPPARNERLHFNELVAGVYLIYSNNQTPGTSIQLEMTEEPLWVIADTAQLTRVVNNLIENALQSIPGDRLGRVELRLQAEDSRAVLAISDNGVGIPEDRRDSIFTPNFTTKSSGMGLGLSMSRSIIEAAGGRLYFESRVGEGTTFFVKLPLQ